MLCEVLLLKCFRKFFVNKGDLYINNATCQFTNVPRVGKSTQNVHKS